MRGKKRFFLSSLFLMAILLLTACDGTTDMQVVSNTSNEEEEKEELKTYEGTLEIGKQFYSQGYKEYIYSGLVGDSVLITVIQNKEVEHTYVYPIYIPMSRKSPFVLPGTDASIQIKEVNSENGTIKMTLIEKQ